MDICFTERVFELGLKNILLLVLISLLKAFAALLKKGIWKKLFVLVDVTSKLKTVPAKSTPELAE